MCNAMEIEKAVGDVNQTDVKDNGGSDTVAFGHRASQPLKGFFVPVSQRDKPSKKFGDEPNLAEDVAKKKRVKPQKNSLEDGSRDFFVPLSAKEKVKKTGSLDAILSTAPLTIAENGAVSGGKQILSLTEDNGSGFFVPLSKRGRSSTDLSKDGACTLDKTPIRAEEGVKKRGRSRKSSLESEENASNASPAGEAGGTPKPRRGRSAKTSFDDPQNITPPGTFQDSITLKQGRPRTGSTLEEEDVAKSSGSLEGTLIPSGPSPHESQVSKSVVAAQKVTNLQIVSDGQAAGEEQKTQDLEGKLVAPGVGSEDHLAQVTSCGDFFLPVSKRRKRKEELVDKKSDETGKVLPKPKSQKDGQEEKNAVGSVHDAVMMQTVLKKEQKFVATGLPAKETASSIPGSAIVREDLDLRLEANLAAQENARLNAGRAPHPFFARKKVASLKTYVSWDEVSSCQADDLQPGPPMHVTQSSEDDRTDFVWPEWTARSRSGDEDTTLEFSEMEPKRCRRMRLYLPSILAELVQQPDSHALSTSDSELAGSLAVNGEERSSDSDETPFFLKDLQDFLQLMQTVKMTTEAVGELARSPEVCQIVDTDFSLENLKNRLSLYTARHEVLSSTENVTMSQISKESNEETGLSTRNVLWTDLYQPRSSKEVCGNTTAVEGLNTWLYKWQLKITGQLVRGEEDNKGLKRDRNADYDSDRGWLDFDSDCDSDDNDNEPGLHNTLLVTGPEGCGKSAAVYACAGEQGFTVIEVNASDCRSGALIKQKFGEAMESHGLGKGSQVGVESPEPASKKGTYTHERNLFAEKRACDKSPIKGQQERLISTQDETQMDSQSKRKTVILFEDVDKHFDEDKGFLTALVQLSKTTKRPIILTSNRHEPGLPPALEKCRVNFHYLTSELVLHTGLVAMAEGVPCSPWILGRLVDACHYDLRKVMMALQFWGQGKLPLHQPSILRESPGSVKIPYQSENQPLSGHGISNNLGLDHKKSMKLNRSSLKQGQGFVDYWESSARWLFELDVHHFILPKVISGSFECPFTLLVGKKINTAVLELEDHMAQVAASESEERARAKRAEYECAELRRKALRKEKDAIRKASQSNPRVLDDGGMNGLSPDEDEIESLSGESWACSPVKSLREAKTLARSPLKSKMKSRRVLLLCDSDDDSVPSLKVESRGLQTGETLTKDHLIGSEVRRRIFAEDGERPLLVADADEKPTTDCNSLVSGGGEYPASLQIGGQQSTQNFDSIGESPVLPISLSGDGKQIENSSIDTRAPERPTFVKESDHVCESGLRSNHGLQRCSGEILQNTEDGLKEFEVMVPLGDLSKGLPDSLRNDSESPPQAVVTISLSTGLDDQIEAEGSNTEDGLKESEVMVPLGDLSKGLPDSLRIGSESLPQAVVTISLSTGLDDQIDAEDSVAPAFEPVNYAWASLRNRQEIPNSLLQHTETSADVASSLADLLDIVSASDVISYAQPEELKDGWRNFDGSFSEAFEGNIGHSSDWDSCQEIASQLVCTGLQLSLPFLPAVNHSDDRLPVLCSILECAKDSHAVGKCMATYFDLTKGSYQSSNLCGMVDNEAKMSLIREGLEDVTQAAVFPRGRVSRSGFVEYSAYLSRMSKLEDTRRTSGIVQGRRPRRFEHRLTSKLQSLSDSDIMKLLKYSNFKSA